MNIDDEWDNYLCEKLDDDHDYNELDKIQNYTDTLLINKSQNQNVNDIPEPTNLYISTKTLITYLSDPIDINYVFWNIKIIDYCEKKDGVLEKQIKIISSTLEDLNIMKEKLLEYKRIKELIMININNPDGRIQFKDVRKISIGTSTKDIITNKRKIKRAFYNCIAIILRICIDGVFKEYHIKIFNTGKLEMPGVKTEKLRDLLVSKTIEYIQPFIQNTITCNNNLSTTVLINSGFNCGFYINREELCNILNYKYNIQSTFDPCPYPGIICKYYYNLDILPTEQTGVLINKTNEIIKISFMIFRTGSVLIVGKCQEPIIEHVYNFVKQLLITEYNNINQPCIITPLKIKSNPKPRKKIITVNI